MGAFDPEEMLGVLHRLVEAESPSGDPEALARCAARLDEACAALLGSPTEHLGDHLVWRRPGERPVLLLGHYDTVWPLGTLAEIPFEVENGVARGPGIFDMKAGIVQGLFALRAAPGPATLLLTADEELGSPTSQALVEEEARGARAVLVLEPSGPDGALKVARKGVAHWEIRITGRAAHAGLEPERGVNAAVELAHQVRGVEALARPDEGTTVTVTRLAGGTAPNVVPESAWFEVDARMWTAEEAERLARDIGGLRPALPDARLEIGGGLNRLPMERSSSEGLLERLRRLGYDLPAVAVGGGSDGNFTAALGIPTLDGLGAVGDGAHARHEHVVLAEMPGRAEMLARLLEDLERDG